ncbi:MAG: tetratricopeptide repeat protein, partial [Reyranellales bacterium]
VAALADCDKALKLMPTNLDVRDTRGFMYMKLGDPAIAIVDYNAALDVDPNRAISLFGRGMAKIKMGQKKEGEADQAAARALNPAVERQFSVYGLD